MPNPTIPSSTQQDDKTIEATARTTPGAHIPHALGRSVRGWNPFHLLVPARPNSISDSSRFGTETRLPATLARAAVACYPTASSVCMIRGNPL